MQLTGTGECSPRKRMASRMSSGPVEQLSPIACTSSAEQGGEHGLDVGAEQHLAAVRQQRDLGLDRQRLAGLLERLAHAEHRGLHLEDVLRGLDQEEVGAALDQALGLLGEDVDAARRSGCCRAWGRPRRGACRSGRSSRTRSGPRPRPCARSAAALHVDLARVVGEAPLVELQPAGLEGVGLDHLGARLHERLVHALDHVRAVEHERLVALALEPAVVLLSQVELLQRGAHPAVVDHDAGVDG